MARSNCLSSKVERISRCEAIRDQSWVVELWCQVARSLGWPVRLGTTLLGRYMYLSSEDNY
jgi:hypothetical protein